MKRMFSFAALALCLAAPAWAGVVIKGSDTVLPLSQKEAEVFLEMHKDASIAVIGGGSGVGIASMIDGTCDIAQASRQIKTKEKRQAKKNGINPVETIIARDALTVIVHPDNPVKQLTIAQIGAIFSGDITNWKEVGGPNKAIVAYSRESSSGTYTFFRERVLGGKEYTAAALLAPATGAIVQSVSQTPSAIGYIGMAYMTENVRALAVADTEGKEYIQADMQTAADGSYPITRDLYYYTNGDPKGETKLFLDFVLSAKGQKLVQDVGYISVQSMSKESE